MQRPITAAADNYVGEEGFFIEEPDTGPEGNVVANFQRANALLRDERGARGTHLSLVLKHCFYK